ncbi:MAG: hypothetical protein FJX31_03255 [Alphaproteobacteria bacterium]|nr:hypothetical protein [Alphaproteobacteria bacterium]
MRPAPQVEDEDAFIGPSPDPKTNLLIADLALRGGALLARRGLERGLLGRRYAPEKARKIIKGRSMSETLLSAAVSRLAMGSVPGAILVGGALLAKTLYDRRKGKAAIRKGEAKIEETGAKGEDSET